MLRRRRADPGRPRAAAARGPDRLPQGRQAPVRRHLQRRGRRSRSTWSTAPWCGPGSGWAGSPRRRCGPRRPRPPSRAGRGRARPSRPRREVLRRRGHADRRPARQRRLPLGDARQRAAPAGGRRAGTRGRRSRLPSAPTTRSSLALPHESAALHVTGHALYTDDLVHRTPRRPARAPGLLARTPTPGSPGLDASPARWRSTGVVRVLTADDVPGVNDAGVKHDEPLFPDEVMFVGHAVCWVLAETLEAARLGARPPSRSTTSRCPRSSALTEAIEAESFQGGRPVVARGDVEEGLAGADPRVQRRSPRWRGRSTSTSRPMPRWPSSTRAARCSCRAAPSTRARRRRSWPTCSASTATTSPCSACGWAAASAARRCSRTASPRSPRSARPSPVGRSGCG